MTDRKPADQTAALTEVDKAEYDKFVQGQPGLQKDTSSGTHEYSKDSSGKVVAGRTTGSTPRYYISKPGSGGSSSGQTPDSSNP